jgi:hypothetical protein
MGCKPVLSCTIFENESCLHIYSLKTICVLSFLSYSSFLYNVPCFTYPIIYLQISATGREVRPTGRVTKFVSGDELDDDFMTGNMYSIPEDKSSDSKIDPSVSKDVHVKSKKEQGPKVVNFVG